MPGWSSLRVLLVVTCFLSSSVWVAAQEADLGAPVVIDLPATSPNGLAYDAGRDRLLISDTGGRRILLATVADFTAGTAVWNDFGFVSATSHPDALLAPQGMAVDASGNVFVADSGRGRIVAFQ